MKGELYLKSVREKMTSKENTDEALKQVIKEVVLFVTHNPIVPKTVMEMFLEFQDKHILMKTTEDKPGLGGEVLKIKMD